MSLFVLMFIVVSIAGGVVRGIVADYRTQMLIVSSLQALLAFALPSVAVAALESKRPLASLSLSRNPGWKPLLTTALIMVMSVWGMNQLVYWNEHLHLPQSMAGVEALFRGWEDASARITEAILSVTSVGGLLSGVLVIGIITGFGEEMFFRAGLQRLLGKSLSHHWAIWIAAVVFSAVHFEFFGFVPRLLLGAFFGYLYYWSGSIWTAVFAHALNNSMVVVSAWLQARGIGGDFDMIGVAEHGVSLDAVVSAVSVALCITWWRRYIKK